MQFKGLTDLTWKDAAAGSLQATFSRFGGPPDRDGDITLASAFQDGSRVPLCWSHKWDQPIGDGQIRVLPDRAVFDGRLWLDTIDGEQAHKKIKNAGPLQDFSYGFSILDAAAGTHDGQPVRILKSLEVFEVSPVLVGAGRETGTDRIKELELDEKAEWTARMINDLPDSAFAVVLDGGSKDDTGKTVPRSLRKLPHHGPGGGIDLPHLRNALARLPQADLPAAAAATAKRHLEAHATGAGVGERSLHALEHIAADIQSELKVGRRFSAASRREIQTAIDALAALIREVTDDEQDADEQAIPVLDIQLRAVTPVWLDQYRTRYRLGGH